MSIVHLMHCTLEVHWFHIVAAAAVVVATATTVHSSLVLVGWSFFFSVCSWCWLSDDGKCVSNSTRTLSPLTAANAFKQTVNELCVRYVLPFAVLFSLCVSIFAFIYPDEFIPDCNCVQCLVSSVSELLCAYTLSVFRSCIPLVQFDFMFPFLYEFSLLCIKSSSFFFLSENQKKKKIYGKRYNSGQWNKKHTSNTVVNNR